jgi:zinc protease
MREKRGLVYSVRTTLESWSGADLVVGRFATENAKVRAAIDLVQRECRRAANGDVADEEVANAKNHLKGAFPVSLDGTAAVAAKLLAVQHLGLGVEYITKWEAMIDAVEPEAVRATTTRNIRPETSPEGL